MKGRELKSIILKLTNLDITPSIYGYCSPFRNQTPIYDGSSDFDKLLKLPKTKKPLIERVSEVSVHYRIICEPIPFNSQRTFSIKLLISKELMKLLKIHLLFQIR